MATKTMPERTRDGSDREDPARRTSAVRVLYEKHKDEVYGFLLRYVGDAGLAEDLLHESFLRVHAAFERYEKDRPFRPWLFKIVRNTAQSALRKKKAASAGDAMERVAQSDRVLRDLSREEALALAKEVLATLSDEERALLIQRHGLGMKLEELAESMDCTERTVTNRLRAAAEQFTRPDNPCKTCSGRGSSEGGKCVHCAGTGREPSKIYVAPSHKDFMEKTRMPEGVGAYYMPEGNFEFYERPVVTFYDPKTFEDRLRVLAHETTHQTEHLALKSGTLLSRPYWLTEGLAVLMSDGVDLEGRRSGKIAFVVPRERLLQIKRCLESQRAYPLKVVLSLSVREFQTDPNLYAYAWSFIHYMLFSDDRLAVAGKKIDLEKAVGRFFLDNVERSASEDPEKGWLAFMRSMGFTTEKSATDAIDVIEAGWKRYIKALKTVPLGRVDADGRYKARSLGLSFDVPRGFGLDPEDGLEMWDVASFSSPAASFTISSWPSSGIEDPLASQSWSWIVRGRFTDFKAGSEEPAEIGSTHAKLFWFEAEKDGKPLRGRALVTQSAGKILVFLGDEGAVVELSKTLRLEK